MPWLGVYIGKIPAVTGKLEVMLIKGVQCVTARLERGSERKDLFHYLVGTHPLTGPFHTVPVHVVLI